MIIFTHRGLEPSNPDFYPESSYEAFKSHLERGFGIEFDPFFTEQGVFVSHNPDLKIVGGRIATLDEVLELIKNSKAELNALHLKGKFQDVSYLDILISNLKNHPQAISKIIIFDVKPEAARYLKSKMPNIQLAPSVAHSFDIKRYNSLVKGTLLSVEEAIKYKKDGLYDWVWLDEWDRADKNGKEKMLYTAEVFDLLKQAGYKIALVTPEMHNTASPGLLGGKNHEDSNDKEMLFKRIKEIISLKPDAICTDNPEEVKNL